MEKEKINYIVLIVLTLFSFELVVQFHHGFGSPLIFSLALIILSVLLLDLLVVHHTLKKIAFNGFVFFIYFCSGAISSYYNAYQTIISIGHLGKAGDLNGIMVILPQYIDIDSVVLTMIFILFLIYFNRMKHSFTSFNKSKFIALIATFLIVALTNYNVFRTDYKEPILSKYGTITYMVSDVYKLFNYPEYKVSESEIQSFINDRDYSDSINDYTAIFEGKNMVFVLVESLEDHIIDEFLPTISSLKNQGLYFSQYYIPRYQAITADSEFIYNTSLIPQLRNGVTFSKYEDNVYSLAMPFAFKEKGYNTYYFHDYYGSFYNREKSFMNLGYDKLFFASEMGIEIEKGMKELPKDEEMFAQAFKIIDSSQPFMAFFTTMSGHQLYERPSTKDYAKFYEGKVSADYDPIFKHYLGAIRLSDDGIKVLIENLRNENILEDTVIVITSDHMAKKAGNEHIKFVENQPYTSYKGPLIIWSDDIKHSNIETLASSFDVYPTIANMFNLNVDYNNFVGTDIMSSNERFIPFYDGEWMTENGYYDTTKMRFHAFSEKEVDISKYCEKVQMEHEIGQAILHKNFFDKKGD